MANVDQAAAALRNELALLQVHEKSIASAQNMVQAATRLKPPVLTDLQFTIVCNTINTIPKNYPVFIPTQNNFDNVLCHLNNAHIVLGARIADINNQLSTITSSSNAALSQPTQPEEQPILFTRTVPITFAPKPESTTVAKEKTSNNPQQPSPSAPKQPAAPPDEAYTQSSNGNRFTIDFKRIGIILFGFLLPALILWLTWFHKETPVNPTYETQLKSLDNTKKAIQSLTTFIDEQKKQLQLSQNAVETLKSEEGRLQPLLQIDRKTIDALFAEQERRNQTAQSHERWLGILIGLFVGVIGSLLSNYLWDLRLKFVNGRLKTGKADAR